MFTRIITGVVGIALAAFVIQTGGALFAGFALVLSVLAWFEYARAFHRKGNNLTFLTGILGLILLWGLVRAVQKAEENGEAQVKTIADKVRAAGFDEAADQMEIFARQEGGHGVRLQAMLDKYQPKKEDTAGKKIYVCPVCGYEYVGDINDEDDSYVCPLCGQPKSAFVLKK